MIARDVMSRPVSAVGKDLPIEAAIRIMSTRGVSGLPVVTNGGAVIGIITEGDLLRRAEIDTAGEPASWLRCVLMPGSAAERYQRTHARRVEEVMTTDVATAPETASLDDIVTLMLRRRIKRVPILRDGVLAGMVSRADLVRRVGESLSQATPGGDDAQVEQAIYAAMDREDWAPHGAITVSVKSGVARLDGCLFDMRQRAALSVLAENVPGVQLVKNRISCIEPTSGFILFEPEDDETEAPDPAAPPAPPNARVPANSAPPSSP